MFNAEPKSLFNTINMWLNWFTMFTYTLYIHYSLNGSGPRFMKLVINNKIRQLFNRSY